MKRKRIPNKYKSGGEYELFQLNDRMCTIMMHGSSSELSQAITREEMTMNTGNIGLFSGKPDAALTKGMPDLGIAQD